MEKSLICVLFAVFCSGNGVVVDVSLEREEAEAPPVVAPFFPLVDIFIIQIFFFRFFQWKLRETLKFCVNLPL